MDTSNEGTTTSAAHIVTHQIGRRSTHGLAAPSRAQHGKARKSPPSDVHSPQPSAATGCRVHSQSCWSKPRAKTSSVPSAPCITAGVAEKRPPRLCGARRAVPSAATDTCQTARSAARALTCGRWGCYLERAGLQGRSCTAPCFHGITHCTLSRTVACMAECNCSAHCWCREQRGARGRAHAHSSARALHCTGGRSPTCNMQGARTSMPPSAEGSTAGPLAHVRPGSAPHAPHRPDPPLVARWRVLCTKVRSAARATTRSPPASCSVHAWRVWVRVQARVGAGASAGASVGAVCRVQCAVCGARCAVCVCIMSTCLPQCADLGHTRKAAAERRPRRPLACTPGRGAGNGLLERAVRRAVLCGKNTDVAQRERLICGGRGRGNGHGRGGRKLRRPQCAVGADG